MIEDFTVQQFKNHPIGYGDRKDVDITKLYKSVKKRFDTFEERNVHLIKDYIKVYDD